MATNSPKPQPTPSPPPSPHPPAPSPFPVPTAGMTMAELEAAIAVLTAKKQRLREAFDSLVVCSPIRIPFRWDHIDAHVSSIQSFIAARFRQLQALQPAAAVGTAMAIPTTASCLERTVEHLVDVVEVQEPHVEHHVDEGNGGGEGGLREKGCLDVEAEEEENRMVEVASEAPNGEEEEKEKMGEPINVSPNEEIHGKCTNAKDAMEMSADKDDGETKTAAAAELEVAIYPIPAFTGGGGAEASARRSLAAACANMDSSSLACILCLSGSSCIIFTRRHFFPALLGAPEPQVLVVRAVRDLLAGTEPIEDSVWESCVELLSCVPKLAVALSADTLEQANLLAKDWKEMIASKNLGRLAVWGLFNFLVSYNIVLDFDVEEIIHFFGILPDNKTESCISLCKYLGMMHKMAGCCSLPLTDRRLYVWTIGGRGLKADRRRGASDRERREKEVAARETSWAVRPSPACAC
ncbi:hypothetical protein E2562_024648 [Oryza meyeriana var. granulata]|uniref:FRIGIDA-like protein n=1 Tax=Oryza meyeriana var. granulata TaxID=110450 RepID=A0A6G1EAD4_9ORYZ|nr:hypothetical protein E2562_024648 [Oryza meyeriana var. granulata]